MNELARLHDVDNTCTRDAKAVGRVVRRTLVCGDEMCMFSVRRQLVRANIAERVLGFVWRTVGGEWPGTHLSSAVFARCTRFFVQSPCASSGVCANDVGGADGPAEDELETAAIFSGKCRGRVWTRVRGVSPPASGLSSGNCQTTTFFLFPALGSL